MSAAAPEMLLMQLHSQGVQLTRRGNRIRVLPPVDADVEELRRVIAEAKPALLALLPDSDSPNPIRREIVHFRLVADPPSAWATALGAPGDTVDVIVRDLRERLGDRLAEWRPRRTQETH
jgi:hypothetical protein